MKLNRKKIVLYLFLIAVVLYGAKIVLVNSGSTMGIPVAQMEAQKEILRVENAVLQEKVLEAQSLRVISQKAKEMGFVPEGKILIIK